MLCLSRKLNETIIIGKGANRVRMTIKDIDRGKIKLVFEAPRSVPINREEVLLPSAAASAPALAAS